MAQEERELLHKDLCARLPYGVMVKAQYKDGEGWKIDDRKLLGLYTDGQVYLDYVYTNIENIKPYLRPMSSMTEEERFDYVASTKEERCIPELPIQPRTESTDWLNKRNFDYRGLIEKGLAIEAPEGMYNLNEK